MTGRTAFERLISHYANGRVICNCRNAYYTNCGKARVRDDHGEMQDINDYPICLHGCSANIDIAKNEIAERVEKEFLSGDNPK